jgi:cellobiose phosphorylase
LFLSEYLRVTKDYDVLKEEVEYFPVLNQSKATVLEFVEQCFIYLRDEVGRGNHGLIRLLNSDWNDGVYFFVKAPFAEVIGSGESHMNSAMAISIFQNLIPELKSAGHDPGLASFSTKIRNIYQSMEIYRASVLEAFMKDMGSRTFPRRMYFNRQSYGDDNMSLEPMGYTLMIDELPVERKKALYDEMKNRIYSGEKLGAREQQAPEFDHPALEKGSRENGGFWWALNGPVINGIAQFDKAEAMRLLNKMTFANFSRAFPEYWTSYWSAADNVESSLVPGEGLADQTGNYPYMPVYCAHPHAWMLYCYFMIREKE